MEEMKIVPAKETGGCSAAFVNFLSSTNLSGCHYITGKNAGPWQKALWIAVNVLFVCLTAYFLVALANDFSRSPTLTFLEKSNYPIDKIPFPAISVCNINKISRKRARQFAEYVAEASKKNLTKIMNYTRMLGSLIDFDDIYVVELREFQAILDAIKGYNFSTRRLMHNLTTPCDEMLQECTWKNEKFNCDEYFVLRLTFEGFCCVFNYIKPFTVNNNTLKKVLFSERGLNGGLSFLVNNNLEDYFYTKFASMGVNLHFFKPIDYPDKNSGKLTELQASPGRDYIFQIVPTQFYAVNEVINYPLHKRKCLFPSEIRTYLDDVYSESDCLVECRAASMKALCDCVPFMVPTHDDENICNLADVQCLHKFQHKWFSLAPDIEHEGLQMEIQDSLRCPHRCYSSCFDTSYAVFTNGIPNPEDNKSRVNILFLTHVGNLYKHDALFYWFEILSYFGGILGVVTGFSFITLIEIFFFFICKSMQKLKN